jgi:hypothetical protein
LTRWWSSSRPPSRTETTTPAWVENDFHLLWDHLSPGSWAGFHRYGCDLPQVTATLDRMLREYAEEVDSIETLPERWLLLVHKRSDHRGFC